ncbi:hypothetical protein M501DRAFT_927613 [Patellaria atrata CBS 101060]|uniref:DNA replication regulator Sld3 C-terminal domain-containing protein n=1 Tax=Patellaria atrata CBS 101060 TaxID=1346257 RepID=A0A9P4SHV2_9PEZI|nr:hypothetical protein M501DRAFT_927613 [Patellaria atrata CBS 101060]
MNNVQINDRVHSKSGRDGTTVETTSTRKRKREHACVQDSLSKTFIIEPCLSSIHKTPFTLTSVAILYRSQVPLSFISVQSHNCPSLPALFTAYIDALEPSDDVEDTSSSGVRILVARADIDNRFYAIERIRCATYALCKLATQVTERVISEMLSGDTDITSNLVGPRNVGVETASQWWKRAVMTRIEKSEQPPAKRPRVSMGQSLIQPIVDTLTHSTPGYTLTSAPPGVRYVQDPSNLMEPQLRAEQVFENVVSQYLEAIYTSKTSLAYFAKGPLSRARAAFSSDHGSSLSSLALPQLTEFLRSITLPLTIMEKKYREKLPGMIKELPLLVLSENENAISPVGMKKKKKAKKIKSDKDGLLPSEDEYVKRWWFSKELTLSYTQDPSSGEQFAKNRLAELRFRETLAQLIIILEILALEASPSFQASNTQVQEANTKTQTQGVTEASTSRKKRAKRPQDLNLILDILVDKLCIWQSVDESEGCLHTAGKSSAALDAGGVVSSTSEERTNDRLRNFCVEVIIPFYMSRLPEQGTMINRKMGGPSAASPVKRPSTKTSASRAPGEVEVRNGGSKNPRRPLQRIATDTANKTQPWQPILSRSATDPVVLPDLKRESSEVPLSTIPFYDSQIKSGSRGAMAQYSRMSRQEVDFSAISAATEAKLKRKAAIEEELKHAISTLKKPNRDMAVKELADSADQRNQAASHRSRKPTTTTRKLFDRVQVTATPRRVKKITKLVQQTPHRASLGDSGYGHAPSSDDVRIQNSAVRPSTSLETDIRPLRALRTLASETNPSVQETPSRRLSKTVHFTQLRGDNSANITAVDQTPSKRRRVIEHPSSPSFIRKTTVAMASSVAFAATPKSKKIVDIVETPESKGFAAGIPSDVGGADADDGDIFKTLGWDDDNGGLL